MVARFQLCDVSITKRRRKPFQRLDSRQCCLSEWECILRSRATVMLLTPPSCSHFTPSLFPWILREKSHYVCCSLISRPSLSSLSCLLHCSKHTVTSWHWTLAFPPHCPEKLAPMLSTTSAFSSFTAKQQNAVRKTKSSEDDACVRVSPLTSPSEQSFHMSQSAFPPICQLFLSSTIFFQCPWHSSLTSFSMGNFAFRYIHTHTQGQKKLKTWNF